ncbi:MAG: Na+/H+ antiporter subunit E [Kiritimatiellia bacterium]
MKSAARIERPNTKPYVSTYLAVLALGTVFWCVWNDSFVPVSICLGLALSALALWITNQQLLHTPYQVLFHINLLTLIRYIGVLIVAIFESGFHAIYITLTGKIDVNIVDIDTQIENPFHGVMIANAITLTPGTVTVDHQKGTFKVLWIESPTRDPEKAAEMIKGKFERVLLPKVAAHRESA